MACNGILLKGPDGTQFCIPIIYEIPIFKIPDPGPVEGPSPEPWKDLIQLSVINEVVLSGLSERIRVPLQQTIRSVLTDLQKQLPKGYSVQLRDQEQEQCSE